MPQIRDQRWLPRLHWRLDRRTIVRALLMSGFVLYGAVVVGSMGRAYAVDGGLASREQELGHLETQLAEAKARTERFQSQVQEFDRDAEVRIGVIRRELRMLRPNEYFVVFK
jgi:hypothetical protein